MQGKPPFPSLAGALRAGRAPGTSVCPHSGELALAERVGEQELIGGWPKWAGAISAYLFRGSWQGLSYKEVCK